MFATLSLVALSILAVIQADPAIKITNNQAGVWYTAPLTSGPGQLQGFIGILSAVNGDGVRVSYDFTNFNLTDSLEYVYHIHGKPVPSDGNCNNTGSHFDKYGVGDDHICDAKEPENCQLGDLSGRHGAITFTNQSSNSSRAQAYHDDFLSTTINNTAFFGNLSVVIHRRRDKFRLACGNFALFQMPGNSSVPIPVPSGGIYPNTTSTTVVATITIDAPDSAKATSGTATKPSTSTVQPAKSTGIQTGGDKGRQSENSGAFVVGIAAMAIML